MKRLTFILSILVACSGGEAEEHPSLSVATYNAGLAMGFVDYGPEREPLIGPALTGIDVDVICLQEVWDLASINAVLEGAKTVFPHHYYEITDSGVVEEEPACTAEGTQDLKNCVLEKCAGIEPSTLGSCALDFCAVEFGSVQPKECVNCLGANIGLATQAATVDEAIGLIIGACLESAGGGFAYEGRNGVMILSRHPLVNKEYLRFESYLNVRVLLHAVAQVPDLGSVDVFCTHLTAFMTGVPYLGDFETWDKEQGQQIDVLLPWIDEKEDPLTPTVILGDMNCSPAKGAGITERHPENFAKFAAAGLTNPYVDDPATGCTWCGSENPLIAGGPDNIIDHVLFANVPKSATYQATRILDESVTFQVGTENLESRYSDHYGARVSLFLPE